MENKPPTNRDVVVRGNKIHLFQGAKGINDLNESRTCGQGLTELKNLKHAELTHKCVCLELE